MARLIDADALKKDWSMGDKCEDCPQDTRRCQYDVDYSRMDICQMIDEAPTIGGWISVKDSLPEEKGWYMVYAPGYSGGSSSGLDSHNGVMFAKWSGKTWSIEVGYHKRPGCVRHWMQMPEPPKEV